MTSLRQFWIWGQKLAKNGRKRPQMTKNGLNVWKVTSETISIGFLLLLRSFWVVTWLVCDNFEFGAKMAKMAKNGRKWPQMTKNGLDVWKVTEIDWFDIVTALTDQFWVPLLTSSSSEAGPAKNLNFGTLKNFSWNATTDHISSFLFTQSAKFLRTRAKSEDMFFSKNEFLSLPIFGHFGPIFAFFWPFWPNCRKTYLTWLFYCKKVERNWKNWAETKNDKFDPQNALKRTQSQKWPLKRLRVAKFGWNASQGT